MPELTAGAAELDTELANADRLQASWAGPGSVVLGVRRYLGWMDVAGILAGAALLDGLFLLGYVLIAGVGNDGCPNDFCTPDTGALVSAALLRWACMTGFACVTAAVAVAVGIRARRNWQVFVTAQVLFVALTSGVCCAQIRHYEALQRLATMYSSHTPG